MLKNLECHHWDNVRLDLHGKDVRKTKNYF